MAALGADIDDLAPARAAPPAYFVCAGAILLAGERRRVASAAFIQLPPVGDAPFCAALLELKTRLDRPTVGRIAPELE